MPDPRLDSDRILARQCDDHDAPCNEYERTRLEAIMQQLSKDMLLSDRDRNWLRNLKDILDTRAR